MLCKTLLTIFLALAIGHPAWAQAVVPRLPRTPAVRSSPAKTAVPEPPQVSVPVVPAAPALNMPTGPTVPSVRPWVLVPPVPPTEPHMGKGASASAVDSVAYLDDSRQGEEDQDREEAQRDRERDRTEEQHQREQERADGLEELYQGGTEALDDRRWDAAIEKFDQVVKQNGSRADGALYWKAYAQNKLGRRADALGTLAELQKSYPRSRWLNDGKALELEVRQASGQKVVPSGESDEELKLMALNGLMNSDPDRALPLLEKTLLSGSQSRQLKQKALFVLAQSGSARARQILADIARGHSNPDLQRKALEDLALFGGKESRQTLADVYASSSDSEVKRSILHDFMICGEREKLFALAKTEKDPDLRTDAIHQLGVMGGQDELWQLYQRESAVKVKETILHSMFVGGNIQRLTEVARTEPNPELRRAAIHSLGISGQQSGPALVEIYQNDKDRSIRETVLQALFVQGNARALIEVARKETDPRLKKDVVSKLAIMNSKEAADYMLEILNK
jgi:HEAT repeat protein